MAFNIIKIVGEDGTEQEAFTNTVSEEAVINSLVAYNNAFSEGVFELKLDGITMIKESVGGKKSYRLPDKLNIAGGMAFTVVSSSLLDLTISYYKQTSDVAAATTLAHDYAADAKADADRAEQALPAGSIDDTSTAADRAWSAKKLAFLEANQKTSINGGGASSSPKASLDLGSASNA